jgi:hypothetical protein
MMIIAGVTIRNLHRKLAGRGQMSVIRMFRQLGLFRRWGGFSAHPDLWNPFKPSFDWES